MKGKQADAKCKQGIANVEAQHDILHNESFQSESKFVSDKSMLILRDYEIDRSSKRNFYLIANNIPDNHLGVVGSRASEKTESSRVSSFEKAESVKLDTVRSGESLIKHFNFDTSKYNSDTDKCVAFWRTLTQTGLEPVKCTLLKGGKSSAMLKQEEEESSDYDSCMWYKALEELQRRKMDEAAFAAIPQQCKLCGQEEPYAKFKNKQGGKYSESELKDYEDLTSLNYWNPNEKRIVLSKTTIQQQHEKSQVLDLPAMTEQLEPPPLITVEDQDNTSTYSNQQSISAERTCGMGDQHTMKLSHSDPCGCGRIRCLCNDNDSDISDELHNIKRSESDPCECGRIRCICNECDELSQEVETANVSLFVEPQETTHAEHKDKDTRKWVCPWHNCSICSKRTIRCCVKCINSYCPVHSDGNVRYDKLLGFICSEHDPTKESQEISNQNPAAVKNSKPSGVSTTEETDVTSTTPDEIDSNPSNQTDKNKEITQFVHSLEDCENCIITNRSEVSNADIPDEQAEEEKPRLRTRGKRKRGRSTRSAGNSPKKIKLSGHVSSEAVVKLKRNFTTSNLLDIPAQNEVKLSSSVPTRHLRITRSGGANTELKRFLSRQSELEKDLPIRKLPVFSNFVIKP